MTDPFCSQVAREDVMDRLGQAQEVERALGDKVDQLLRSIEQMGLTVGNQVRLGVDLGSHAVADEPLHAGCQRRARYAARRSAETYKLVCHGVLHPAPRLLGRHSVSHDALAHPVATALTHCFPPSQHRQLTHIRPLQHHLLRPFLPHALSPFGSPRRRCLGAAADAGPLRYARSECRRAA